MQEPYIEGVANHDDPESCAVGREGEGEALTGARMGTDIEPRKQQSGAPTPLPGAEGNMTRGRYREPSNGPARSKTRDTCGTFLRENREIPTSPTTDGVVGRTGKAHGRTPVMYDVGKSDRPVLSTKSPNKAGQPAAEAMEKRGLAKGNTGEQNALRTQCRQGAHSALERVRQPRRQNPRQEPSAVAPLAGICAGGGPSLLWTKGRPYRDQRTWFPPDGFPRRRRVEIWFISRSPTS